MNAVRAKIEESPEEYRYSSSRYYILGEPDDIITEDPGYSGFGVNKEDRQNEYLKYLLEMDEDKAGKELSEEVVGSEEFKSKLRKKEGRLVPKRQGRPVPGIKL